MLRHLLQHLQDARVFLKADHVDRHQYTQNQALVRDRFDCAVALLLAQLAQHGRPRQFRHQHRALAAGMGNHLAARGKQRRFVDTGLFTQGIQGGDMFLCRAHRQRSGHHVGFFGQVLEQVVERGAAEIQAAFERFLDAHVEPGFDAFGNKLHGHAIDEGARQHRNQRKQNHQAQRELGAEYAGLELLPQREKLVAEQGRQTGGQSAIEGEQQRILLREQGRVRGRGRQQVEGHGANYDAEHQQIGHRAAFQRRAEIGQLQHHGLTLQRCQSELRFQSRDARALS